MTVSAKTAKMNPVVPSDTPLAAATIGKNGASRLNMTELMATPRHSPVNPTRCLHLCVGMGWLFSPPSCFFFALSSRACFAAGTLAGAVRTIGAAGPFLPPFFFFCALRSSVLFVVLRRVVVCSSKKCPSGGDKHRDMGLSAAAACGCERG